MPARDFIPSGPLSKAGARPASPPPAEEQGVCGGGVPCRVASPRGGLPLTYSPWAIYYKNEPSGIHIEYKAWKIHK